MKKTRWQGVYVRHGTGCPARRSGRCSCRPGYRAKVYDSATRKARWSPTMQSPEAASAWRRDTLGAIERGTVGGTTTVREAADAFLEAARHGGARNRYGRTYKREAIRDYQGMFDRYLMALDSRSLSDVRRVDVQQIVDSMLANGKSASTVRSAITALKAMWRWAQTRDLVLDSPFTGVRMPADDSAPRSRVPTPSELASLLVALPLADQAPFALAAYATGRRQEIRALRWTAVDLEAGVIRWGQDVDARKTPQARRNVSIVKPLKTILERLPRAHDLVLPGERGGMFSAEALLRRCRKAWENAGLQPVGLHDCRHAAASYMIASGANLKELSSIMGHASIAITADRYGHLFTGAADQVRDALDVYLAGQGG